MSPSETDPLLSQSTSAPEIVGYGFSKGQHQDSQYQSLSQTEVQEDDKENNHNTGTDDVFTQGTSPLRTLIALFTIVVGLAFIITVVVERDNVSPPWRSPDTTTTIEARVDKILAETPLIDGHNDLAILIRFVYGNKIYDKNFTSRFENGGMPGHVDLPRLREKGKVGGTFWSAFTPCPADGTDFSDENYAESVAMTLSQLDLLQRLTAAYPDTFAPAHLNSTSALLAFKETKRLISPIGIEGLHQIGNSMSNLRLYHFLGVKYATLTHNCHNAFADAALVTDESQKIIAAPPFWGGLSKKGESLIQEMNRIGMLVDISHVSKDTMLDVLGGRPEKTPGSKSPVIFSHSSAFALCPHPRNVPDDILHLVQKTHSIVMVNFAPEFVSCVPSDASSGIPDFFPPNSTLHQVARHVHYIGNLIGFDHVGLGSDFDGIFTTPEGLEDVGKYPDLVAELLRMGVSDGDAAKVAGGNVLRVWGEAERVGVEMRAEGVLPGEDVVAEMVVPA